MGNLSHGRGVLAKLGPLWHGIAFRAWNAFILMLGLNLILAVVFRAQDAYRARNTNAIQERYHNLRDGIPLVYPGMSERQVNALLNETWEKPFIYEPFTGFAEDVRNGEYVNVSKNGYRVGTDQ